MPNDTTTEADNLPKTLQDVTEVTFEPSEFDKLGTLAARIAELTNPIVNGDWISKEEFPSTHRVIVMPIGESVKQSDGTSKHVTKNVVIAAVPTLHAVYNHKTGDEHTGREYLDRALLAAQKAKLRNTVNRAEGDFTNTPLPFEIDEFIERASRGVSDQGLKAFSEIQTRIVNTINKKYPSIAITKQMLRPVLQSSRLAEALYPKVPQKFWEGVITSCKTLVENEKKGSTEVFDRWLETRDNAVSEAEIGEDAEFSLA